MANCEPQTLVRRMTITRVEFLRCLPRAAPGMKQHIEGARIRLEDSARRVGIDLGHQGEHSIGSLVLPQTEVRLQFEGFSGSEREAFLKRFDLAYQRGGG